MEKKRKTGHLIVTYKVRLYDRHFDWLYETKELYARVVKHFFLVLVKEKQLLQLSDFQLLRELEILCIGTKEMKANHIAPAYPLMNVPKIPLYFRRSAINAAIELVRKQTVSKTEITLDARMQLEEQQEQEIDKLVRKAPMTFYKGMYQNFTDTSIELKLFHGKRFVWVTYPFTRREFPQNAKRLSPILSFQNKSVYLNIPVSLEVSDIRTVKERMLEEERICAISFPDYDVVAVAIIFSKEGKVIGKKFFHGGKQKEQRRKQILRKLKESKESRTKQQENGKENPMVSFDTMIQENNFVQEDKQQENSFIKEEDKQKSSSIQKDSKQKNPFMQEDRNQENAYLYEKLRNLNHYYAHKISRQLVDYCVEQNIRLIVVPNYEHSLDFRKKRYLSTDAYRWLGRSIIKNLKYKAFASGIVVTSIRPIHISDTCSECGAKIRKYNEGHMASANYHGGKLFVCPNGHRGNTAENSAKNIGRKFLELFN